MFKNANNDNRSHSEKKTTGLAKTVGNCVWMLSFAHIFCLYLQNAWTNFRDFWNTSTLFYSEHIRLFRVSEIHHTKWRHV